MESLVNCDFCSGERGGWGRGKSHMKGRGCWSSLSGVNYEFWYRVFRRECLYS